MDKIRNYFANAFIRSEEISIGARRLNELCKWILVLLRNCIIVGALQFLAKKSGSLLVEVIATLGLCALFGYVLSYTRVAFRPFYFLAGSRWGARLDSIADQILFIAIAVLVTICVQIVVQIFAQIQLR